MARLRSRLLPALLLALAAAGVDGLAEDPQPGHIQQLESEARACFAHKRVLTAGNSVTRQWAFLLGDLLGGGMASVLTSHRPLLGRHDEQRACARAMSHQHRMCSLHPPNSTTVIDHLQQTDIFNTEAGAVLALPPAYDVVVANMGLDDLVKVYQPHLYPTREGVPPPPFNKFEAARYWRSRLVVQAPLLAAALQALPNTTYVLWRTTSWWCAYNGPRDSESPQAQWHWYNRGSQVVNAHVLAVLPPAPRVHVMDAWELTRGCAGFEDQVHHPGAAIDHVLLFMSRYCGPQLSRLVLATSPHLAPHFDANGTVLPRNCRAQLAGPVPLNNSTATADWEWHSAQSEHTVLC